MEALEWATAGGESGAARRIAGNALRELAEPTEDPIGYGRATFPAQAGQRVVVKIWAALNIGFATVQVAADPLVNDAEEATVESARTELGDGEPAGIRTQDTRIKSPLLCR